jgi:hypothetical protein
MYLSLFTLAYNYWSLNIGLCLKLIDILSDWIWSPFGYSVGRVNIREFFETNYLRQSGALGVE